MLPDVLILKYLRILFRKPVIQIAQASGAAALGM